ncbi:unnamed protein product, partial [Ascophyllum nodosum]
GFQEDNRWPLRHARAQVLRHHGRSQASLQGAGEAAPPRQDRGGRCSRRANESIEYGLRGEPYY